MVAAARRVALIARGGGLNLAITNIRRANHSNVKPVRLNTASLAELMAAGLSENAAGLIVAFRSTTDRSFTVAEFIQKLAHEGEDVTALQVVGDFAF